jgi:hypothetical protein
MTDAEIYIIEIITDAILSTINTEDQIEEVLQ